MYVALKLREGYKGPDNEGALTGVRVSPARSPWVNKRISPIQLLVSSIFMRHLRLCKQWSLGKDEGGGNYSSTFRPRNS